MQPNKPRVRRRRLSFALAAASFVMLIAPHAEAQGPAPVRVEPVRLEVVRVRRAVTGDLRAVRRADVASREGGLVVELLVEEGDRVREGDVLARLDARRLTIQLETVVAEKAVAQALKAQREAETRIWRDEVASLENAMSQGGANLKELSDARTNLAAAEAALAQAERQIPVIDARAEYLSTRLADMEIAAPFTGVVTARLAQVGEWVGEGESVVQLVDVDTLDAWLTIDQRYLPAVSGLDPQVTIEPATGNGPIDLRRVRLIPDVHPVARTFTLIGRFDAADLGLAPGVSVVGWIPTGEEAEHVTISKDAVVRNALGPFVYVVRGEPGAQAAMPAQIDVFFETAGRVAVRPGALQPGDLVIVEGNERLYPTAPVTIVASGHAGGGAP